MSQPPQNLSADIRCLIDEGYEVEIRALHLLVHHVPYLDSARQVKFGILISKLSFAGDRVQWPGTNGDHIAYFTGDFPCFPDGRPMEGLRHQSNPITLVDGLVAQHSFSNKPPGNYIDYHHKMTRYVEMLSDQARAVDPSAKAITHKLIELGDEHSVFVYPDTNSSRAEITAVSNRLSGLKIAIIGLGGTGAYVLDQAAKTPVEQIHIFDGDLFAHHNAFRAPGAPAMETLHDPPLKVDYFAERYSQMHRGIKVHRHYVSSETVTPLAEMDFVFICVDKPLAKRVIFDYLEAAGKPFIDVGMGLQLVDGQILGTARATLSTPANRNTARQAVSLVDDGDDVYSTNIQVADLNMLNASLAVIRWKKLYGFYHDRNQEFHSTYTIDSHMLTE